MILIRRWLPRIQRSCYDTERRFLLHIYLPDDYASGNNTYPVMYFFDGHNLFFDQDATFGRSWRFLDYLHSWNKDLIFVGMECSHDGNARLYEYMPYPTNSKYLREAPCIGDATLQWIVNDIKPSIDSRFPTIPNRQCTAIGGSSMGGLMAFYGGTAYNHVFSKAACVSSSFIFCPRTVLSALDHCNIDPDTRIYLSYVIPIQGSICPTADRKSGESKTPGPKTIPVMCTAVINLSRTNSTGQAPQPCSISRKAAVIVKRIGRSRFPSLCPGSGSPEKNKSTGLSLYQLE